MARIMPPQNTYQKTFGVLLSAAIISVPVALVMSPQGLVGASTLALSMTVLLGIFPTAIAGLILFWLINEAGPSFVSVSNYLIPAFALGLGVVWLDEHLSLRILAGFALILTGVWISQMRQRRMAAQSS
jgi:drug/metabolite transporter (DMT)-like permease